MSSRCFPMEWEPYDLWRCGSCGLIHWDHPTHEPEPPCDPECTAWDDEEDWDDWEEDEEDWEDDE